MKDKHVDDILLFGGGIIPEEDLKKLKELGVGELFTPGASTQEIIKYLKEWAAKHPRD
jgi:methylmalonyl-CoA mutase C-terminal domain/subunit